MATNGIYVAVGGTSNENVILTSPDAANWSVRLLAPGDGFSTVAYGNGTFVAAEAGSWQNQISLYASADGLRWQPEPSAPYYGSSSIFRQNGAWLLAVNDDSDYGIGSGQLYTSSDLLTWLEVVTNTAPISAIASDGELAIACCADGSLLNSTSLTNWANPATALVPAYPVDLEYLDGQFVDVAWGQLAFSEDGTIWTNSATNESILSITYGKGVFVAGTQFRTVLVSTDAVHWTNPAPQINIPPYVANVSVAYGNGVFVGAAGYEADILTSPDGTNWTVQQLETNYGTYVYFSDVKFGDGRFVAVGGSAIATSIDGTNWFYQNTNQYVSAIACGADTFVAVGPYGTLVSHDGTNWTPGITTPLNGVAFGDGYFVAVGSGTEAVGYALESPILYSADGVHWASAHSNTPRSLGQVAFGDGTFVISGAEGVILQSQPILLLGMGSGQPGQLQLNGPVGKSYRIDFTAGLDGAPEWQPLGTYFVSQSPATILDSNFVNGTQRFYRATLLSQ